MGHRTTDVGCYNLGDIIQAKSGRFDITKFGADLASQQTGAAKLSEDCSGPYPNRSTLLGVQAEVAGVRNCGSDQVEVTFAGKEFISGFGLVLTRWIDATLETNRAQRVTPFHSSKAPAMSIQEYLKRIRKYFACSDECFVIALVFIDRIGKVDPAMTVCALNAHRLLLIAVMLAAKVQDDVYYSNGYYSKVGGLDLTEVNKLEVTFLSMLDFKAYVDPQEYQLYHTLVCKATSADAPSHREPEPEPCGRTTM